MYETTQNLTPAGRTTRRTWLAVGTGLAAVLALLILLAAACQARSDRADPAAGAAGTPAPTATDLTADPADGNDEPASGVGEGGGNQGGDPGGNQGDNSGGGGAPGQDDDSEEPDGSEDPDDDEPAGPLSIEVAITAVAPNGHCSASGAITVDGGEYPLAVDFQWRQLVQGEGWDGVPVSPVQSHTFDAPGGISVQTKDLPEDGTNVMLIVTSPKSAGSGAVGYDGCSGQAGGGTIGG